MKKLKWMILSLVMVMLFSTMPIGVQAYTIHIGNYYYYIESALDSNMVVDVDNASRDDGANIHLWEKNGTDAQLFRIERSGDGYYALINKGSNKAIDVYNAENYCGANVNQWSQNGTSAQQWKLYNASGYPDGYVCIKNRCGKYLDVNNAETYNGNNIHIWDKNGTKAQVFKLVPYIQTTYKTITLGSFSTFDEWVEQMQRAEQKAVGFARLGYNLSGNLTNYGQMIIGKTVLESKIIPVTYNEYGRNKTVKYKLPSKVKFELHKHNIQTNVWFDFSNLTATQHCACGEWSQVQWEVPYPDEDDLNRSYNYAVY